MQVVCLMVHIAVCGGHNKHYKIFEILFMFLQLSNFFHSCKMENGLPMLTCLLQSTLRSLCSCSDSSTTPSKWVYAIFWRILPRNYPPPKWDHGDAVLDRAKETKRNWILVWEDGFCDFCECERTENKFVERKFGAEIYFKMTHEVYNFGEGLVGKVASDNSHKWVYKDSPTEKDSTFTSPWNVSIDPQPRAWEAQFSSGIETIAIISVREGAIQLGSFDKVVEDLSLVVSIQRKFSYIFQSMSGMYAVQRPCQTIQDPNFIDYKNAQRLMHTSGFDDHKEHRTAGSKRQNHDHMDHGSPTKSVYLGYNSPHDGDSGSLPFWPIPPLLPLMPSNLGAFLGKMPAVQVPCYSHGGIHDHANNLLDNNLEGGPGRDLKGNECDAVFAAVPAIDAKVAIVSGLVEKALEEKPNQTIRDGVVPLGFEHHGGS